MATTNQQTRGAGRGTSSAKRPRPMSSTEKDRLPASKFAFPEERKEPLVDAGHVRNAIARFDQVEGVSDAERDRAWKRIRAAARKYDVEVSVRGWRQLSHRGNRNSR
jgi:hypothetical protein